MIRFVVGPDRMIVPRPVCTAARTGNVVECAGGCGRNRPRQGCFCQSSPWPRSPCPPDRLSTLQAGLLRRIGELLGLARRAGQAVGGFQKAREWVSTSRAALVIQASDGSAEECTRLTGARTILVIRPLSAAALGAVWGRDRVVHVAIGPGRLAAALKTEAERLTRRVRRRWARRDDRCGHDRAGWNEATGRVDERRRQRSGRGKGPAVSPTCGSARAGPDCGCRIRSAEFQHGRSKVVQVEVRKKRIGAPCAHGTGTGSHPARRALRRHHATPLPEAGRRPGPGAPDRDGTRRAPAGACRPAA